MPKLSRFQLVVILFSPFWIWLAWLLWQNDALYTKIQAGSLEYSDSQSFSSFPPLVTKPLLSVIAQGERSINIDDSFLLNVAEEYIKRRPLDPNGWISASRFLQRNGESEKSTNHLAVAHLLSKTNTPDLMNVFNRYLELGQIEKAVPVARDLVYARPDSFRKLFYLLVRLNSDYESLVSQIIPESVPTHREFEPDLYYSWALKDAVRAKNSELAKAVWNRMPDDFRLDSKLGMTYLNYLVRTQDWLQVKPVWRDIAGIQPQRDQISIADFETDFGDNTPCWSSIENNAASWSIDPKGFQDSKSLMIEFNGEENINFYHISCFIPVEPGAAYRLSAVWSGRGISTRSGPYIDLRAPGRKFYKYSESEIGDWSWRPLEVSFEVPADVQVLSLRIRRNKTDFIDSKIAGRVWFDNFKLEKVVHKNSDDLSQVYGRGM